jgi:hypothetical protein
VANTALAKRNNLILTSRFYVGRNPNPKKINPSLVPHDLGALEAKTSHQTLLIESEGVDAAILRGYHWLH